MVKTVRIATAVIKDDIVTRNNISNYSNYKRLLRVTARVLSMYHTDSKPTFFNIKREPTAEGLMKAEDLWIKEAQRNMQVEVKLYYYPVSIASHVSA